MVTYGRIGTAYVSQSNQVRKKNMTQQYTHQNSGNQLLIFPAGTPRALDYLQKCQRENRPVIGASSLAHDPSRAHYPAWLTLPYVTDNDFDQALHAAIALRGINEIYTSNPVVWDHLNRVLGQLAPGVRLANESPVKIELSGYASAREHANAWLETPLPLASSDVPRPCMSKIELAALFRHADTIPGMCDNEKMFALCEIARRSTIGDIVEIGSWWGKSAFLLARLALCYSIGKLLCVDPWSNQHLIQHDEKGLVDRVSAQLDAEQALEIFEMNLLPYNQQHINYLRMPSTEGALHYQSRQAIYTASFGTTIYKGNIALLHIDGNHSYDAVKADIQSWCHFVNTGGWIIIDDYIWPYGDGPKRAGDEFLREHHTCIGTAFVMGSALFIQLITTLA